MGISLTPLGTAMGTISALGQMRLMVWRTAVTFTGLVEPTAIFMG
jgi:hypothetical protein